MTEKAIDTLLLSYKGTEHDYKPEWSWDRYMVGAKMFAALCPPSETSAEEYRNHPLLTLKCDPVDASLLRNEYPDILPGYYMNKENWVSLRLDGEVPEELIKTLCYNAYQLIFMKLSKKLQREISEA